MAHWSYSEQHVVAGKVVRMRGECLECEGVTQLELCGRDTCATMSPQQALQINSAFCQFPNAPALSVQHVQKGSCVAVWDEQHHHIHTGFVEKKEFEMTAAGTEYTYLVNSKHYNPKHVLSLGVTSAQGGCLLPASGVASNALP